MKFILEKDKLFIEEKEKPNSGSINYYEVDVEYDNSWENLTLYAIIAQKEGNYYAKDGIAIPVLNDKVFIDNSLSGTFAIGFIGYTIENQKKVYQISSGMQKIHFNTGAGEIEATNTDVPTASQWELYIAQIEELLDNFSGVPEGGTTGQALVKKSNADGDVEWQTIQGGGGIVPTVTGTTLELVSTSVSVVGEELIF